MTEVITAGMSAGEAARILQRRFEDDALAFRVSAENGKMIPNLLNIANLCDNMAKLATLVRKLDT